MDGESNQIKDPEYFSIECKATSKKAVVTIECKEDMDSHQLAIVLIELGTKIFKGEGEYL